MAYRDEHNDPRRSERRTHGEPARHSWDAGDTRDSGDELARHDPAQRSYGRAGAPDVHGAPSGGYRPDTQADPGYNTPGYMRHVRDPWRGGDAGAYTPHRDSWRGSQGWHGGQAQASQAHWQDERWRDLDHSQQRYQGGAGGPDSNRNPYAGSQTYGGYGDQLGYGSYDEEQRQRGQHHDPDYLRWREQQMRALDADYQSWRGERYKKFSEEFDSWRKSREGATQATGTAVDGGAAAPSSAKPVGGSGNS